LGGGSIIARKDDCLSIGPTSVGYEICKHAHVFGGQVLTATDIAVAGNNCIIGDQLAVSHLVKSFVQDCLQKIQTMIEESIDHMKTSVTPIPVILVGGGSVLIGDNVQLKGVSEVIKPDYYLVANAVGSAIAQVSGSIDKVVEMTIETRMQVLQELKSEAIEITVQNGAIRETVEILEMEEFAVSYVFTKSVRVYIKAVGNLDIKKLVEKNEDVNDGSDINTSGDSSETVPKYEKISMTISPVNSIIDYRPTVVNNEWILTETDVDFISIGAGVLGTGGGGSTLYGCHHLKRLIRNDHKIRVIKPQSLSNDATVYPIAFMGSPAVLIEKFIKGDEGIRAVRSIEQLTGRKASAVMSGEIGGLNCFIPMLYASQLGVPIVDCDGLGRAFPKVNMYIPFIHGASPVPICITDEKGNELLMSNSNSGDPYKAIESFLRTISVQMGAIGTIAMSPLSYSQIQTSTVHNSISQCWRIGKCISLASVTKQDPVQILLQEQRGKLLFSGKVIDIFRRNESGFSSGTVTIEGTSSYKTQTIFIEIQNENLIARLRKQDQTEEVVACVPDLISVLDVTSGTSIATEELKYGLRVYVIALPAPSQLTTDQALNVVGPAAFGYKDIQYKLMDNYSPAKSVLDE
jgi:DUF917 family protein